MSLEHRLRRLERLAGHDPCPVPQVQWRTVRAGEQTPPRQPCPACGQFHDRIDIIEVVIPAGAEPGEGRGQP